MMTLKNKNRLFVVLIFGMSVIPFAMAWLLGGKAPFIEGKTNKGQLISPVIMTKRSDFAGLDVFSNAHLGEMAGHWLLLNVIPGQQCANDCLEAVHKVRQLHLMMNKDLTRIRRVAVFFKDAPLSVNHMLLDDKVLLKVKPSQVLGQKIVALIGEPIPEGILLLMDPLGNLMMRYEPGFDPYKVKSDLMHLLRISQIG